MNNDSIFNNPRMYRAKFEDIQQLPEASEAVFALMADEEIHHTYLGYNSTSVKEIREMIDSIDVTIIEEIARSKYLTSLQVYEFLRLRGIRVKRPRLRKRILKLMKYRLIQENELIVPDTTHGIKYFCLDVKGHQLAKEQGVIFHMGNRYLSLAKQTELGIFDTPQDVKRILVGNQIIVGLLLSGAKMERFGVMETFRVESAHAELDECIIRTAATVKIDESSVLAYEVVRDCPQAYENLSDKVQRYFKILHCKKYLDYNYHGDSVFPQLIICGESLDHNRRIVKYLKEKGLWNAEDVILFTEDLLNMKDSLQSIYEIAGENEIRWYRLPGENLTVMQEKYKKIIKNVF